MFHKYGTERVRVTNVRKEEDLKLKWSNEFFKCVPGWLIVSLLSILQGFLLFDDFQEYRLPFRVDTEIKDGERNKARKLKALPGYLPVSQAAFIRGKTDQGITKQHRPNQTWQQPDTTRPEGVALSSDQGRHIVFVQQQWKVPRCRSPWVFF